MNEEKLTFNRSYENPALREFITREMMLVGPLMDFSWSKLPASTSELIQSFLNRHCPPGFTHKRRHMEQDLRRIWVEAEHYGRFQEMQDRPEKPKARRWWWPWKR